MKGRKGGIGSIRSVSFSGYTSSSEARSDLMRRNKRTGGRAECLLATLMKSRRLRFDQQVANLRGAPDFVFRERRVAVFCDGDFWHGRRWKERRRKLTSGANAPYWLAKIASNRARDARVRRALRREGWLVVRLWETDVLADPAAALSEVVAAIKHRRPASLNR
jgi:DNA mismatch endonuclease (patch repair protein)